MMIYAKKMPILTACILAFVLGASGVLAYSPFDYWGMAYISTLGLLWATLHNTRKAALWASFAWSLGYFGFGISWVHISLMQFGGVPESLSYVAVILLAAYLALYNLLFSYIAHRFQFKQPIVFASLFTATEYLRGTVLTGFPWLQFGYSQIDSPIASVATVFGVEGLNFLVMLISGYLLRIGFQLLKINPFKLTDYAMFGIISLIAIDAKDLNFIKVDQEKAPIKVSLVQGNIPLQMKWNEAYFTQNIATYDQLLTPLFGKNDVVVLPESALAAPESGLVPLLEHWQAQGIESNTEIIMGTLYQSPNQGIFNSATVLANPAQPYAFHQSARYNKHHLVPFGEYLPFGKLLDWMRDIFILPINLSQGDFVQKPLFAKQRQFNMAICYEIVFGDQVQQNQKANPSDYLLTITNDAWFGSSIGPWQHFQMARMRALELGKPLLRAANTGITAVVNPDGSVAQQLPQFEVGVLSAEVPSYKGETFYSQFGNRILYSFSLLSLIVAFAVYARKAKRKK